MEPPSRKYSRVLVTGASGFLGGAICRVFLAQGQAVHGTWLNHPVPPGVTPHRVKFKDGTPTGGWLEAFSRAAPDLVVHLASPVQPERTPADANLASAIVGGTCQVAASCLAADTRLLVVGTCDEYGDGPSPFVEDQAPQPVSPYSEAKAQATAEVLEQIQHEGLRATVVRPFLTYGPGQRGPRLIPSAIDAALSRSPFSMTDGTQTREFTHVDDMARALVSACAPEAVGLLLNLGSGDEHAVQHVVRRIFALCDAPLSLVQAGNLPRRQGEVDRFVGDHRRARSVISFLPRVPLEEGLQHTIDARRGHAAAAG